MAKLCQMTYAARDRQSRAVLVVAINTITSELRGMVNWPIDEVDTTRILLGHGFAPAKSALESQNWAPLHITALTVESLEKQLKGAGMFVPAPDSFTFLVGDQLLVVTQDYQGTGAVIYAEVSNLSYETTQAFVTALDGLPFTGPVRNYSQGSLRIKLPIDFSASGQIHATNHAPKRLTWMQVAQAIADQFESVMEPAE